MRSKISKIAIMMLVFCLSVSMLVINASAADSESASDTKTYERYVSDSYDAETVAKYIAGDNTYPKKDGYVFAGWYTDADATSPLRDAKPGEKTYALFIPEQVLSVKAQVSANLTDGALNNDDSASLRFVTTVDSVKYDKVGFDLSYVNSSGKTLRATNMSDRVYEELYVAGTTERSTKTVTPQSEFCNLSKYFRACTVTGLSEENGMYETAFTARPFWITLEGDKVYGVEATKKIVDGCLRDEVWVSTETDSDGNVTGVNAINYGSYDYPYATLDYAIEHVVDGGIVHVKDSVTIAAGTTWTPHCKNVTITGDDKDEAVEKLIYTASEGFDIYINDGVTFTDLEWTLPTGFTIRIFAQGHKLVIKDDVTFTNESATVQLLGGSQSTTVESTHLEVYAGTYSAIFGGSDAKDVLGDTKVIVGGKVNSGIKATEHSKAHILFGAGWKGTVYGNTNIEVQSGAKFNYVFGGGDNAASVVKGSTNISFAGEAMAIYGGSAAGVSGDTHVKMTGGYVEQIFGGSESKSVTGNTDVQILGGTVARRIYGGCYNDYSSSGWADTTNAVTGYTSVTFGPGVENQYATLKTNYEDDSLAGWLGVDDSTYYAVSRSESNYAYEKGVFIVNDYNVESNPNVNMAGVTDFMDDYSNSSPYHYLVNATDGGEVYSAGDCIYIVPDKTDSATYAATVTVGGQIVHYTEEASYYPLPDLTSSTETIVVTFGNVTSDKTEAQTTFINSAKATIGTAYYATEAQAVTAAEHKKDAVITLTANATENLASITILKSENGTVTTDTKNCIISSDDPKTVTLTVTPDEGYNLTGLDVKKDGVTVDVGITTTFAGGEYVFTPEAGVYTVEAIFERKIFVEQTGWDVTTQYDGKVILNSGRTADSKWLDLYDTYGDIDITLTVRDCIGAIEDKPEVSSVIKLKFGDKFAAFRIGGLKENGEIVYKVQSYGGDDSLYSWKTYGTLTTEEVAAYQSEQGLKFRLVRSGTDVFLYVGDRRVCEAIDLRYNNSGVETYITAATKATVSIKQDGNLDSTDNPFAIEFPFELSAIAPERVTIDLPECENGSFTTEYAKYLDGDSVVLTATGDEYTNANSATNRYYYSELKVNNNDVTLDKNGTYTFEANKLKYTVEGSFAKAIFQYNNAGWNLHNQSAGLVATTSWNTNGNSVWLYLDDTYTNIDMTMLVKEYEDTEKPITRTSMQFDFGNSNKINFGIAKNATSVAGVYKYSVQTLQGDSIVEANTDLYILNDEEVAKMKNGGVELRVVRDGTLVDIYVDGICRYQQDLTKTDKNVATNIEADTEATVSIRRFDDKHYIDLPITVSSELPKTGTFNIVENENGTISSATQKYIIGKKVMLTITPNEGYDCTGLKADGVDVTGDMVTNEDGTCSYIFATAEDSHTIEAVYKQKVNITIVQAENGTISTTEEQYYLGDTVTITAVGNNLTDMRGESNKYYYSELKVDDTDVTLGKDGTYSFEATKTEYTITGSFAEPILRANTLAYWNVINQNKGLLVQNGIYPNNNADNAAGIDLLDTYCNSDVSIIVKANEDDFDADGNFLDTVNGDRTGFGYWLSGGDTYGYSILLDNKGNYTVAHAGTTNAAALSGLGKWATFYTLTPEESKMIIEGDGIELRVVRIGQEAKVYLDGKWIYTSPLSYAADQETTVWIKRWDDHTNKDVNPEIPFKVSTDIPKTATIDMSGVTLTDVNGTSLGTIQVVDTTDHTGATVTDINEMSYIVGQKVVLKVEATTGYCPNLQVNGEQVVLDWDTMTYSFIAKETNVITGAFEPSLFKSTVTGWDLFNQKVGIVRATQQSSSGHTNWLDFADTYTNIDVTMMAREYPDTVKPNLTRTALRFTFANGKIITFSVAKNTYGSGYKYSVQSLSGDSVVAANYDFYVMNQDEIDKFNSEEGIEFRVIRTGTTVDVYLDGNLVVNDFDLTQNESGVTADMGMAVTIRRYDDPFVTELPLTVSTDLPETATVSIAETENGTVTTDKESYIVGEKVTLTVTANKGYAYNSLKIDGGEDITVGWDGTYTFTATKALHEVTASFAPSLFDADASGWNLAKQHMGIVMATYQNSNGNTNWLNFANTYTDIDVTMMAREYPDTAKPDLTRTALRFTFANGKIITFSVAKNTEGSGYKYSVQSLLGDTIVAKDHDFYVLSQKEIDKFNSEEGIEFQVIRTGTTVDVYLDGNLVVEDFDLTQNESGVTADMEMNVAIRRFDDPDIDTELPLTITSPSPVAVSISETENGKITVNSAVNYIGDIVVLAATSKEGYA